jgi:hypothetical protein
VCAQTDSLPVPGQPVDSVAMDSLAIDTLPVPGVVVDSTIRDSLRVGIRIADDALDEKVDYGAEDSIIYDNGNKTVHLYGGAYVHYTSLQLKAGYIRLELDKDLAHAEGAPDSTGRMSSFPHFIDGDQEFEARLMKYNFKTKKAYIESIVSTEGDLYIRGARTKYIKGGPEAEIPFDQISNEDAIFTTCDHPEPHFGIRSRKQKMIPNRLVVVGPSNVEVAGIPSPLWLPFGFFPMTQGKRSGIIFPRDWESSPRLGLGVRGIGYYFPINDYVDLTVKGNIYFRGTWGLDVFSNYKKKYRYNGNITASYANQVLEDPVTFEPTRNPGFNLQWNHTQDPKANPYHQFNGRVSLQTNNFRSNNFNDARSVLQNEISSSMTYTWRPAERPFTVTAAFNHSQNTGTRKMILNMPNIDFNMQQIRPFARKTRVGKEQWYEKITFKYDTRFRNRVEAQDTTFFEKETWDNAQYGFEHRAGVQAPFRAFKYFTVNPSMNYQEYWYFKTRDKVFDPATVIREVSRDTIDGEEIIRNDTIFGQVLDRTDWGFEPFRTFNSGVNVSTQVFGTMQFRQGYVRGVRHMIKANFGFSFTPDFQSSRFGYLDTVNTDTRPEFNRPLGFNRFANGPFGTPSVPGESRMLTFSFINNIEAKVFSRKDSTVKKVRLLQNLTVGGNYNFAADSLKWSTINMRTTTQLIKGVSTANITAIWDPYRVNENDQRVDRFVFDQTRVPLRLDRWNVSVNSRLRVAQILGWLDGSSSTDRTDQDKKTDGMASPWKTFFHLFKEFNISHDISLTRINRSRIDTLMIDNHTVSINGGLTIARNWRVGIQQFGYDIKNKGISYPYFVFERDLHCWALSFAWAPDRNAYTISLGVKPGSLDFIKVPFRQNQFDGGFNPF